MVERRSIRMLLRRVLEVIAISIVVMALLAACGIVAILIIAAYRPNYDIESEDYRRYDAVFSRLREQFSTRDPTKTDVIDLAQLNDGNWKTACIFGGYTAPTEHMTRLGAVIDEHDHVRLSEAASRGFRISQVEESEILIAYVDWNNRAHFVHFQRGIGPNGQYMRRCIAKPETRVVLDVLD